MNAIKIGNVTNEGTYFWVEFPGRVEIVIVRGQATDAVNSMNHEGKGMLTPPSIA